MFVTGRREGWLWSIKERERKGAVRSKGRLGASSWWDPCSKGTKQGHSPVLGRARCLRQGLQRSFGSAVTAQGAVSPATVMMMEQMSLQKPCLGSQEASQAWNARTLLEANRGMRSDSRTPGIASHGSVLAKHQLQRPPSPHLPRPHDHGCLNHATWVQAGSAALSHCCLPGLSGSWQVPTQSGVRWEPGTSLSHEVRQGWGHDATGRQSLVLPQLLLRAWAGSYLSGWWHEWGWFQRG